MADTALVLVPIPKGVNAQGDLVVSIVVAPRLSGDRRLGGFPDMLEWTARLAAAEPRVELRFGATVVTAAPEVGALRPAAWSALFGERTPVEPFEFDDYSERLVVSYRTREGAQAIERRYAELSVQHPAAPPSAQDTAQLLDELATPNVPPDELRDLLARHRITMYERQRDRGTRPDTLAETMRDYSLYHRMPQRSEEAERAGSVLPTREELAAKVDFHRALTAVGNYPALQRALGLVLDVHVRGDAIAPSGEPGFPLADLAVVQFVPAAGWRGNVELMMPPVLYRHRRAAPGRAPAFFAADQAGADMLEGFLALDAARFHLLDFDVDGTLARLTSLATMLPRAPAWVDGALPALRSAGLALAAHDRGREVVQALRRAAQIAGDLAANAGTPLGARDLVRGYRLDVWSSATNRWHSLHERDATYRLGADGAVRVEAVEEGFAQLATASPVPDPTRAPTGGPPVETDLYVHERIGRWTGWSLSAPQPGQPINRSADPHRATDPDPTADELVTAFGLRPTFAPVRRSLPRLRYGTSYRIRARAVDLAGNSPRFEPTETGPSTDPAFQVSLPRPPGGTPYLRYEPVPHPLVVLRSAAGARPPSLLRLVIRSFNAEPALDAVLTQEIDERHIGPPRTSAEIAERHGMLDTTAGVRADAATFAMLVARHDAVLPTVEVGDPPKEVPIAPEAAMPVEYLPDPAARAAALRFLPGMPAGRVARAGAGFEQSDDPSGEAGPIMHVQFGTGWPERRAFRMQLVDGAAPPGWNALERVLSVALPKSTQTRASLSSSIGEADLEVLGLWAWQRRHLETLARQAIVAGGEGLAAALEEHTRLAARLGRLALEGAQWALTPAIALELVHAVQQPLGRPAFRELPAGALDYALRAARSLPSPLQAGDAPLAAWRQRGSPDLLLTGGLEIHYPSTGRIDLEVHWDDVVDDGGDSDEWRRIVKESGTVEPLRLVEPAPAEIAAQAAEPRTVALADAAAQRLLFVPERDVGGGVSAPAAPIHRIGHTRHVVATYRAIATSRFTDDFAGEGELTFTRSSEPITIHVPSSAPPTAPGIRGVVPTFGWRRETAGTVTTSVREGCGIRIFVDRPWYSSGDGELLGVVVWTAGRPAPSDLDRRDRYARIVTQWGVDPVRRSGRLAPMPTLADLPNAVASATGLAVAAAPGVPFAVAGHKVAFDEQRNAWYADVTLRADIAYMPFVRLALARFQPHSIPGVEISPIAVADVVQLTPDRSAVLIRDPDAPTLYRLIVSGFAPLPSPLAPWRSQIVVTVQERDAALDDVLGWRDVGPEVARVTPVDPPPNSPAVLFSGYVELASAAQPGRLRILVRELETWSTVPPEDQPAPAAPAPAPELVAAQGAVQRLGDLIGAAPAGETLHALPGFTGLALERLRDVHSAPTTRTRLVYAEALALEPLAASADVTERAVYRPIPMRDPDPEVALPPHKGPPVPAPPDWAEMPALSLADRGAARGDVKLAQALLNAAGIAGPPLVVDGFFGTKTAAAVTSFRGQTLLPAGAALDPSAWVALALAAPFPILERGVGNPPMAGPPIKWLQHLLNVSAGEIVAPETGAYDAATQDAVGAFQAQSGLPSTGVFDLQTWLRVDDLLVATEPTGVERVVLDFDRDRFEGGGELFELVEREPLERQPAPVSAPLDADWTGRIGFWIELRDGLGTLVFRQIVANPPTRPREVLLEDGPKRDGEPPRRAALELVLPVIPAARSLAVLGSLDDPAPAGLLRAFDPW